VRFHELYTPCDGSLSTIYKLTEINITNIGADSIWAAEKCPGTLYTTWAKVSFRPICSCSILPSLERKVFL